MDSILVSEIIKDQPNIGNSEISFIFLKENIDKYRNRFINSNFTISFVLEGQKQIFVPHGNTLVKKQEGILIPEGNSIMSEYSSKDSYYSRLIVIFSKETFAKIAINNHFTIEKKVTDKNIPFLHFSTNIYLDQFVEQVKSLILSGQNISERVALLKLEELLIILYELYPKQIMQLLNENTDKQTLQLKNVIENNLLNNLTIEELAFLCNRSLASFKRDFEKNFSISPQKYIRYRKMEMSARDLSNGNNPNEIYENYGYENVSNFNAAFKRHFGVLPSDYKKNK